MRSLHFLPHAYKGRQGEIGVDKGIETWEKGVAGRDGAATWPPHPDPEADAPEGDSANVQCLARIPTR